MRIVRTVRDWAVFVRMLVEFYRFLN